MFIAIAVIALFDPIWDGKATKLSGSPISKGYMFKPLPSSSLFDPIWDGTSNQNCQVPLISRRDYMFIGIAVIALFDPFGVVCWLVILCYKHVNPSGSAKSLS
jgi:hypothetical protein